MAKRQSRERRRHRCRSFVKCGFEKNGFEKLLLEALGGIQWLIANHIRRASLCARDLPNELAVN